MKYDPNIHHRRSIRLQRYDYSQAGYYYITICVQDKSCLFGKIENEVMGLNDAGMMIEKWYNELKCKFGNIELHKQIIMPNHFHGIIQIINKIDCDSVGADLCVCPDTNTKRGQPHRVAPTDIEKPNQHTNPPLHEMVQWLKTMTTNDYIRNVKQNHWKPFNKKLWQRNYYEHIIRNEKSYNQISEYIRTNPMRWEDDEYYQQ